MDERPTTALMPCSSCSQAASTDLAQRQRERAVICHACPWGQSGEVCDRAGTSLVQVTAGLLACPVGKHPLPSGEVKWLGLLWKGVPMPVRQYAQLQAKRLGKPFSPLPGCGCLVVLRKVLGGPWEGLFRRLSWGIVGALVVWLWLKKATTPQRS